MAETASGGLAFPATTKNGGFIGGGQLAISEPCAIYDQGRLVRWDYSDGGMSEPRAHSESHG